MIRSRKRLDDSDDDDEEGTDGDNQKRAQLNPDKPSDAGVKCHGACAAKC